MISRYMLTGVCLLVAFAGCAAPAAPLTEHQGQGCPTQRVAVLAVENFYASLVDQIGAGCVSTTTILSNPDADPHEYQPVSSDVRAYQTARLVVENGLGYDDFSDKIIATLSTPPKIVRAADVLGLQIGANPHVWYSAAYVDQIRAAIVAGLKQVDPDASAYFDARAALLDQAFSTYHSLVTQIASQYGHQPIGATESIAVYLAQSCQLDLISPPDLMQAVSEGNEPSARGIASFQAQIQNHQIKVLVYNAQTVTGLTDQLQELAQRNNVPIVGVSETMPSDAGTFQDWQVRQLQALLAALQQATAA
jgi:zinc/manganese transport system substrate-binding protein